MKRHNIILMIVCVILLCTTITLLACSNNIGKNTDMPSGNRYKSYTVIFDYGDEKKVHVSNDTASGKVKQPENPIRSGYTFDGWYITSDYNTAYDFNTIVERDFTLYAKWIKNKNKINFDGNGSTSGSMDEIQAETESVIRLPQNSFVRVGYTFVGWSDTATGVVKNLDGGWFYMQDLSTVVLFAVWQANEYTVTLDHQGGTSDVEKVTSIYNSTLPSVNKPIKAGFVFGGYFSRPDGNGDIYYNSEMSGMLQFNSTENITLYAYWLVAENKLVFAGNGSTSGDTASIDTETFAQVVLPNCGFERTGYKFCEWNTLPNGMGDSYSEGETFIVPADESTITLYAVWRANSYTIVFNDNYSATQVSEKHIYDTAQSLADNSFSRYGYDFVGWNDTENGTGNYYQDGQEVINVTDEDEAVIVFYAVWAPVKVTLTFDKTGGSGGTNYVDIIFGNKLPAAIAPRKAGYKFDGYYKDSDCSGAMYYDSDMTPLCLSDIGENNSLFAKWLPMPNTLVLEPNGGDGQSIRISTETDAVISLANYPIKRLGYTLSGWNTSDCADGLSYSKDAEYTLPASDYEVILYATWSPNALRVVFNGNGNTSGTTNSLNGYCDRDIVLPESGYEKLGYTFIGWSLTAIGEKLYSSASLFRLPVVNTDRVELFAQWKLVNYKITYNLDGGTNSLNNPDEYNYSSASILLQNPSRLGYRFICWAEGNSIPTNSIGDKTFTAKWDLIHYNIIYVLNANNVVNNNKTTYTVLDEIILNNPSHNTKKFEGWVEGNTIIRGSTGDKTFTAQWNDPTYAIIYDLDGGQNGAGNPSSYTAESPTIKLVAPQKTGFTFKGWTCVELGIGTPISAVTINKGSTGNKTLVAHWEIITYRIEYVLNGGINSEVNPDTYTILSGEILLDDPWRDGYTFDGWQEGTIIENGSHGDLTFTAIWTAIQYNINIFDGVDELPKIFPYTIESGTVVIKIGESTDTEANYIITMQSDTKTIGIKNIGHRLLGWYEVGDEENIKSAIFISAGEVGDRYFVAEWEIVDYSITYDLANGEISQGSNPEKYTVEDADIILIAPTRTGYEFIGWTNENGESVSIIFGGSIGDISLKATWEVIEYSITYDLGDENAVNDCNNPIIYTVNDEEIILGAPTRTGFTFCGWEDENGHLISSIPHGSTGNIIIKAKWIEDTKVL